MGRIFIFIYVVLSSQVLIANPIYNQLTSHSHFKTLSTNPLSSKYGQVSGVKVVYDLRTRKIHYVDGNEYQYHYLYCNKKLRFSDDLQVFNDQNYSTHPKRRFILANINYFESTNRYILEFSPVDEIAPNFINTLYSTITSTSFIKKDLFLILNSTHLSKIKNEIRNSIKTITPADIYQNQSYQAISKYKGIGTLKFIDDLSASINDIKPSDIIVINETPLYLPQVAGIICSEFQTPLSHISILGQNRKLPVAAFKHCFESKELRSLNGQNVQLSIESDTFFVKKSLDKPTIYKPTGQIDLHYNLRADSLIGVEQLNLKSKYYVGNKAANFAHLNTLSKLYDFKTPECGFAIPFYFYNQHINNSNTKQAINDFLNNVDALNNQDSIIVGLKKIRKLIKNTPINAQLLTSIESRLKNQNEFTRFRFRSSTNAEDAVGFSGAGLYTSKTGIIGDTDKSIEIAIKKVWASMWSYEAFTERMYYNINHRNAFMGILVHRAFPEEAVNGVAITKNIYRPDSYGYVVNAQIGNENVVNPTSGVTCDQFICYPDLKMKIYAGKNSNDVITVSSLNHGNLTMTEDEIKHLANQLRRIKSNYFRSASTTKSFVEYGLDIEFKLDGADRVLYIKQARYYND